MGTAHTGGTTSGQLGGEVHIGSLAYVQVGLEAPFVARLTMLDVKDLRRLVMSHGW
jgi:hypothetical protein